MEVWHLLRLAAGRWIWLVPVLIGLGLAASVADGLGLGLLVLLLQLMLGGGIEAAGSGGLFHGIYRAVTAVIGENVIVVAAATVGLIVMKALLIALYNGLSSAMNARVNDRLRNILIQHVLEDEHALLGQKRHGQLLNLVTAESVHATEAFWCLFAMGIDLCAIAVFGTMLLLISWPLVLVVAAGTLVASLVTRLLAMRARVRGAALTQAHAAHAARAASVIGGIRVIRAFGREGDETARLARESDRIRRAFEAVQFLKAATAPVAEGLYLVAFVGIVAVAAWQSTPLPSVITFVVILARLQPHVKDLDWCRVQLSGHAATVEALLGLLRRPRPAAGARGSRTAPALRTGVRFENVGFRYPGSEAATLEGLTFEIARGRTTAIVGGSGAGKSTVTNLLLRFYEPTAGEIRVDGVPLADLDPASWRARLAIAGQDADLIDGSILDNVRYGRPEAGPEEVEAALADAGILAFVRTLPKGVDTQVGERGLSLSGGQRQRLSLARALLRRADILILDEATNALDALLEAEIQATIARVAPTTTLVVIAHRLSTVANADHVVVLRHGRIVEQGSPGALLADDAGLFRQLYGAQDAVAAAGLSRVVHAAV